MKIRNLAYAAMIAVAFTACSNGDDPAVTPEPEAGTTLNISIKNVQTRATDADIASLTVIVADAGGTIEQVYPATLRTNLVTNDETGKFPIEQGSKQVMVIANVTVPTTLVNSNISAIETTLIAMKDEGVSKLSMNSKLYTVNIQANTRNYLGYTEDRITALEALESTTATIGRFYMDTPVKLYRNVARVVINSIKMGSSWKANTTYPKPSFEVMDITAVQTHKYSKLASLKEWGTTNDASAWISPLTATNFSTFTTNGVWGRAAGIEPDFADFPLRADLTPFIGYKDAANDDETYAVEEGEEGIILYVYENTSVDHNGMTLISLRGKFSYDDAEGVRQTEMRRYTFAVGVTGFWPVKNTDPAAYGYNLPGGDFTADLYTTAAGRSFTLPDDAEASAVKRNAIGVLRNLQYNVDLTINGKGYGGGDDGDDDDDDDDEPDPYGPDETQFLDVTVEVVNWGQITQTVDVD